MNKSILVLINVLGFYCIAYGQSPVETGTTSLPSEPLIVRKMPEFAQWTVDYTYKDKPKPGEVSAILAQWQRLAAQDPLVAKQMTDPNFVYALDPARPLRRVVMKTKSVRSDICDFERNLRGEIWTDGITVVERKPNSNKLTTSKIPDEGIREFQEFNWISQDNFVAISILSGRKCLVFKDDVDFVGIDHPQVHGAAKETKVPATAYIDMDTRNPVMLEVAGNTRVYTYLAAPSQMLSLPPDFAAAAKQAEDHFNRALAKTHLAPP